MRTTVFQLVSAAVFFLAALAPVTGASEDAPADSSRVVSAAADSAAHQPAAILYYFHRTVRCQTCLTIEAYIDEAIRTHFADALEDGRLVWQPTNIEEPENVHFTEEFSLEFSSAILVRLDGEESVSWSNLEKVWDLLENRESFLGYVRSNVAGALAQDPPASE